MSNQSTATKKGPPPRRPVDISDADFSTFSVPSQPSQSTAQQDASVASSMLLPLGGNIIGNNSAPPAVGVTEGHDPMLDRRRGPPTAGVATQAPRNAAFLTELFGSTTTTAPTLPQQPWRKRPRDDATSSTTGRRGQVADALLLVNVSNTDALDETPLERSRNFAAAVKVFETQSMNAAEQSSSWLSPLWCEAYDNITANNPWDSAFLQSYATAPIDARIENPRLQRHPFIEDELSSSSNNSAATTSGRSSSAQLIAHASSYAQKFKTPDEIRKERREAALKKAEALRATQKQNAENHMDRLTRRNLTNQNIQLRLGVDTIEEAESAIDEAMRVRNEAHQLRNYERHVAAIPHQEAKKIADLWRDAEASPRLQAYYIPKARNVHCINRLRKYANDVKLRGFVLWIAEEAAAVVLAGGDVAMRHLDRWICEKMDWQRLPTTTSTTTTDDAENDRLSAVVKKPIAASLLEKTKGTPLCTVPLHRVGDVSVLLSAVDDEGRRSRNAELLEKRRQSRVEELVFVRHAETVSAAMAFLCESMPAGGVFSSFDFIGRLLLDAMMTSS